MIDDNNAQAPTPVDEQNQQTVDAPGDDKPPVSGNREGANRSGLACLGLLALTPDQTPSALWAITDLAERARALAEMVPSFCEDPEWVKLIRSVRVAAGGDIGASLQSRIGSEEAWKDGRKRWKQHIKEIRKALDEQTSDFSHFEVLFKRSAVEGRLFLTKERFYEQAFEDWLWDFDHSVDEGLSVEDIEKSKVEALRSGQAWRTVIDAEAYRLKCFEFDYKSDGDALHTYNKNNLFLMSAGYGKITRAEFLGGSDRCFRAITTELYRILMREPITLFSAEE